MRNDKCEDDARRQYIIPKSLESSLMIIVQVPVRTIGARVVASYLGTSMEARVVHSPVTGLYDTNSWTKRFFILVYSTQPEKYTSETFYVH